jgi:predicted NBD/HSP70 family sugar kinase
VDPRQGTATGGDLTRSAVLAELGRFGPLSRAEVARRLEISPATVTQITRRLLEQGMIEELAQAPSRGGRPAQLLGLVGSAGRAVGVKVAADHLAVVDVRLDGELLDSHIEPFDTEAPDAVDALISALRPFSRRDSQRPRLLGIGVGVPGVVDRPDSGVVDAAVLGWSKVNLGAALRQALGIPVLVENDVKALAVAERLYGRGRSLSDFIVVTIGRGVGLAIVADGSIYRGGRGGAGEFGHVPIDPDGPQCDCGNRGCLEALIGLRALMTRARAVGAVGADGTVGDLTAAADRGDAAAREIFVGAGTLLGRAVAGLVNVLDPGSVLVAGEGTAAWSHWEAGFRPAFAAHVMSSAAGVPVEVEPWDDRSWAQGAAALVLATPFATNGVSGRQAELVLARLHGDPSGDLSSDHSADEYDGES